MFPNAKKERKQKFKQAEQKAAATVAKGAANLAAAVSNSLNDSSKQPKPSNNEGFLGTVGRVAKHVGRAALNWAVSEPVAEIIVDLAGALFGAPPPATLRGQRVDRHYSSHGWAPKLSADEAIPSGTVLFTVPISPHMCRLPENRLTQMASVRAFFEFQDAFIHQIPSESEFVGGSVAMFILPDPATEIEFTDKESIQALVSEYGGVVKKINTAGSLKIGPPQRQLSIDDLYNADPRDNFQGRLYIVAFSEIPAGAVLPAYEVRIRKPMWAGKSVPGITPLDTRVIPTAVITYNNRTLPTNVQTFELTKNTTLQIGEPFITFDSSSMYVVDPGVYNLEIYGLWTLFFNVSPSVTNGDLNQVVNVQKLLDDGTTWSTIAALQNPYFLNTNSSAASSLVVSQLIPQQKSYVVQFTKQTQIRAFAATQIAITAGVNVSSITINEFRATFQRIASVQGIDADYALHKIHLVQNLYVEEKDSGKALEAEIAELKDKLEENKEIVETAKRVVSNVGRRFSTDTGSSSH